MTIDTIISRLKLRYPPGNFDSQDPFRVLIATVLSQRTRDEITDRAAGKLLAKYGTCSALSHAQIGDIEELIKEDNDFNGEVPADIEKLLLLPGVGRKTANCVLVYGFGKDAVAVDTHVHRISNRLGLVRTKTPQETESELMRVLPMRYWRHINELLVRFGQDLCKPLSPKCGMCPVSDVCPSRKINK